MKEKLDWKRSAHLRDWKSQVREQDIELIEKLMADAKAEARLDIISYFSEYNVPITMFASEVQDIIINEIE